LIVIATRPGVGKTLIANTIARDIQELNKDQDFNVLHFQVEMLAQNLGIRELSAGTNLNVRYIQSAEDDGMPKLTTMDLAKLQKYADSQDGRNEYIIDISMTVAQMKDTIVKFYEFMGKKPIVITLDHTLLIKQAASETSRQITLQNLSVMLTEMKNRYPVTFIILSQLNRSIDEAERQKPGQLSNYPTDADVYGSDFLMQCADVMIAYNRPAKYNLSSYGPLRYIITPTDKYLLAMHVLKNRFGSIGVHWYKADYPTMSLQEAPEPSQKAKFST
jgi:replicative DNA helicase